MKPEHRLLSLCDLPNEEGFNFFAVTLQDIEMRACVVKDKDGVHYLQTSNTHQTLNLKALKGWRRENLQPILPIEFQ